MKKLSLSKQLIEQIVSKILEEAIVDKIAVFGSQVRSDHRNGSDIDIALFGAKSERAPLLKDKLNEELNTLLDVDLVLFDDLENKKLKDRILKEGVIIYERNPK